MSRITKQEASQYADKLLEKRKSEYQLKVQSFITDVRNEWMKKHPDIIIEAFDKHPEYFTDRTYFKYGVKNEKGYKDSITLMLRHNNKYEYGSTDFSPDIIKKEKEIIDIKEKIIKAEIELTDYIYKLGTPQKINLVFPELEVKEKVKTVSIINDELLKWVKSEQKN